MQYHLLPTLEYPKYAYIRQEQARLNQSTQVFMIPTLREKNMKLTEFNSIIHQQHYKVSSYSGYFICKKTISSVQHSHECSTILQVDYIQITQQAQPIYIPHNVSLQEHALQLHIIQRNTSYISYLTFTIKIWPQKHSQWHQIHDWQTSL